MKCKICGLDTTEGSKKVEYDHLYCAKRNNCSFRWETYTVKT